MLVAVVAGLAGFHGSERQFRSWTLTITHRRLVDDYRRTTRRPDVLMAEPEFAALGSRTANVENEAMERLRMTGLLELVDRLTPDQRAALMLRALADLPVSEIASVMGKPESAVKALLRRGIASLRRQLETEQEVL